MKINSGLRPFGKNMNSPDTVSTQQVLPKSFSDMMHQNEEKANREQLQQMLEEIHRQGEQLAKSMTVRELRMYKNLVKKFLEDTARRGVALKETSGWDRRGRSKRYKLLEEIDSSLLELADELLAEEQGRLQILNKVGEIRGMLINLLF